MTMTYFADLSTYAYSRFGTDDTLNIGWLDAAHPFPTGSVETDAVDALWQYCKVSVAQTRGLHQCELCPPGPGRRYPQAERNGEKLLLGTSEIRVFGEGEKIFAAPTLVYHYVVAHDYVPPRIFIDALIATPAPPAIEYFDRLRRHGIEWRQTSAPDPNPFGTPSG